MSNNLVNLLKLNSLGHKVVMVEEYRTFGNCGYFAPELLGKVTGNDQRLETTSSRIQYEMFGEYPLSAENAKDWKLIKKTLKVK